MKMSVYEANEWVTKNINLIFSSIIGIKFPPNGIFDIKDLESEAVVHAVSLLTSDRYDPEKGAISTFIVDNVRHYIREYVKVTTSTFTVTKYGVEQKGFNGGKMIVNVDALAAKSAENDDKVIEFGRNDENIDRITAEDCSLDEVRKFFATLTEREKAVVTRYFGFGNRDPENFATIAVEIGATPPTVKAIYNSAINKMREIAFE